MSGSMDVTRPPRPASGRFERFAGFALVGASGLVVNQLVLWALTSKVGIYYLASAVLATQASTIWNFVLVERFVFNGPREGRWARFGWFELMNTAWLLLRTPFLYLLTDSVGLNYLVSNALVLGAMTLVRFGIADNFIWAEERHENAQGIKGSRRRGTHLYDVHGLLGIESESRLPELERFEVDALLGPADLVITVSGEGFGGFRRRVAVIEEENTVSYIEHLGRFGFAAKIDVDTLARIQVSPFLRRSPHVLYTNVVEPVVRWLMVRQGLILAHAACLQIDGHGVLITARTDTGKTTTCLKSIKEHGSGFVSDDMVIIDREGNAFSYPKPLTISSHTLHAIKGAPLSLPRRAWLQVQGRLHSKFGRSVGMAIGNINLPIASMSAIVQMIIPPPKFHVDTLIPGASIVPTLGLDRMIVIERGDALVQALDDQEAFEILSENTEDAYGFPPYPRIAHALANGEATLEQNIRRSMTDGLDAVLLRTPDRAWFELLPTLAAVGVPASTEAVVTLSGDDALVDISDAVATQPQAPDLVIVEPVIGEQLPALHAVGNGNGSGATTARPFVPPHKVQLDRHGDLITSAQAEEIAHALNTAVGLLHKVCSMLEGEEHEAAVAELSASASSLQGVGLSFGRDR